MRESPTKAGPPKRVIQLCEIGLTRPRPALWGRSVWHRPRHSSIPCIM